MNLRVASISAVSLGFFLALGGCLSLVPPENKAQKGDISGLIAESKVTVSDRDDIDGAVSIALNGVEASRGLEYLLFLPANETKFYQIPPGTYRLVAPPTWLGMPSKNLKVKLFNHSYSLPVSDSIRESPLIDLRPGETFPLGIFRVDASTAAAPSFHIAISLDRTPAARREILQQIISTWLSPSQPATFQEAAESWAQALQRALLSVTKSQ